MNYCIFKTRVGEILVASDERGLRFVGLPSGKSKVVPGDDWVLDENIMRPVKSQLLEYLAGERQTFELKLAPHGTPFQLAVLDALLTIPYGETRSYSEIAQQIGKPSAVRAVGGANGRNPLPIVIPCHRVIGANGSLTGFGGGVELKEDLLRLESRQPGLPLEVRA